MLAFSSALRLRMSLRAPPPGSYPTAIYTSPIISFLTVSDVCMFASALRRSHHPLYMPYGVICLRAHLITAPQRFPTIVQAHIDSRPPKIKHFTAHLPATHSYVRQASAALTRDDFQDMDHSVPKKPISPSPPSSGTPAAP